MRARRTVWVVPHIFDADVVSAVLHHMNHDHADDSVLIARAFSGFGDDVTDAVMTALDGDGGVWTVTAGVETAPLRVPWPGGSITERPEIRREVVALHDLACARLGVTPRPHA